jgi:hypothetical protein
MEPGDAQQPIDLDDLKTLVGQFLLKEVTPLTALKTDSEAIRLKWADQVSFAVISGMLLRLVEKHRKEFDVIFWQAIDLIADFAYKDTGKHPKDSLEEKLPRWINKFKKLPTFPTIKKSKKTGKTRPLLPHILVEYENTLKKLNKHLSRTNNAAFYEKTLKKIFPDLADSDAEWFATELVKDYNIERIAKYIIARKFGWGKEDDINLDFIEKRYLWPAKELAQKLDDAWRYR